MLKVALCMTGCLLGLAVLTVMTVRDYLVTCELEAATMGGDRDE